MTKLSLYAVIVVYNRRLSSSPSYRALVAARDGNGLSLTVCDNSTDSDTAESNLSITADDGVTYIPMGGNVGLPRAYNRAIGNLTATVSDRSAAENSLLCLFDDDTDVPADYFTLLRHAADESPGAGVFLPVVRDGNGGIMSPCDIHGCRVHRATDPSSIPAKRLTGINSGMALRLSVFDLVTYDEGYFLDYVDHAMLRELRARGVSVAVFNSTIIQDFSRDARVGRAAAQRRFLIFKRDFTRFCAAGGLWGRVYAALYIRRRQRQIERMPE